MAARRWLRQFGTATQKAGQCNTQAILKLAEINLTEYPIELGDLKKIAEAANIFKNTTMAVRADGPISRLLQYGCLTG
jgi:hypothetical protein